MTAVEAERSDPEESGECRSGLSSRNSGVFWAGCALALVAFVSYFGFTLQKTGSAGFTWIHELLAVVGATAAVFAVWRGRRRWTSWVGAGFVVLLASLLLAYVHLVSSQLPSTEGVVQVGQPAPGFSLPDAAGHIVSLEMFRGKPLALIFYRGYW